MLVLEISPYDFLLNKAYFLDLNRGNDLLSEEDYGREVRCASILREMPG